MHVPMVITLKSTASRRGAMPKAIPEGYGTVTPYLVLRDTKAAIEFYQRALGATEIYRLPMPDGKIGHAEIQVGGSRIMLSDENEKWGSRSALALGGSPASLCVYTEDVDALVDRFVAAGGVEVMPLQNQFYGDRSGTYRDPEGYHWTLSQHVEDVEPEVIRERMMKRLNEAPA
jgi:PhnB protein